MSKKLKIRDLTLRDGQQSLFATRMSQAQIDRVLPLYTKANFYAMEVWGGAVPDSIMRFLNENPWDRLEKINKGINGVSKLTALSRGRNLFGYNPYPNEIIEGFNDIAVKSGIGIMRIFDALNDTENVLPTIKYVKNAGGLADCAVCYTVDPNFNTIDRIKALLHATKLNTKIFTDDYFLEKAKIFEKNGADIITIKDMAGLIKPKRTGQLIRLFKNNLTTPIDFHTHCTPGYGLASTLMAIINGVDIVDTNILSFSGGPAAASIELIILFCDKLGLEVEVNREVLPQIDIELRKIRQELSDFDTSKQIPINFNIVDDKLPAEIDNMFNKAIECARKEDEIGLLEKCHAIEKYFNFPAPNIKVKEAEVPGGMYTNMLAQLKQLKLENLLPRTLELIPTVRMAAGCPPLVTPTSQIVGAQAVNCAIDELNGQKMYTTKSIQFVNLVKGIYGKTPIKIDPEFRYKIAGVKEETPYDTSFYKKQENPIFEEYGGIKLVENEKDELLLELFPSVAIGFFQNRVEQNYLSEIHKIEEEIRLKYEAEKEEYNKLSTEEKKERLIEGLYNYKWTSESEDDFQIGHS